MAFRGGQLTLSNWKEIIELHFVRRCFQVQLMTSTTLQLIFGADSEVLRSKMSLSKLEKRQYMSKTSETPKQTCNERNKNRKSRINAQSYFIDADGENM